MLAGAVLPAVDGALGAAPHVLAHAAIDLVLRLVALGHRVLCSDVGLRGSRPPLSRLPGTDRSLPKRRPEPRVAKRKPAQTAGLCGGFLGGKRAGVKLRGSTEP